ncbi:MAG: glycosyltransferase [Parcubacteria group bacterium]
MKEDMKKDKITVLYFGMYDPKYARNSVLIKGLRENDVNVIECQDSSPGLKKFVRLFKKHRKLKGQYDIMVVGFLGHIIVPFAKLITRKPVVFDAFVSLYDSNIFDRKLAPKCSIKALWYWLLDWISFRLADIVLFDTQQHVNYAIKTFGGRAEKFKSIFIGAQDSIFKPVDPADAPIKQYDFEVLFYGGFIPLQGIQYILKAIKLLEGKGIDFTIIGDGQEKKKMLTLADELELKDTHFEGFADLDTVVKRIARTDVCLGIFGDTPKTRRVIPNKVYECIAMAKPVISSDTPASRELFSGDDVLLVDVADAESLADGIIRLKDDKHLRESFAKQGYNMFQKHTCPKVLGFQLKKILCASL